MHCEKLVVGEVGASVAGMCFLLYIVVAVKQSSVCSFFLYSRRVEALRLCIFVSLRLRCVGQPENLSLVYTVRTG